MSQRQVAYSAVVLLAVACGCRESTHLPPAAIRTGAQRMGDLLEEIKIRTPDENPFLGDAELRRLEDRVNHLPAQATMLYRFHLHWSMGLHQLRLGKTGEAIASLEQAARLLGSAAAGLAPEVIDRFLLQRAVASLRQAENDNCVNCRNSASCLMPIAGPGVHREQKATREAIAHLKVLLERNPAHPTAVWLLNIASMAAGDYPDKVPGEYLIPPHKFASEEDFPRFLDVAQELGVSGPADMCGGTIIDDFDGDGYLDIVCSSWDTLHAGMHYFRNNADGTFVDRTAEAGLADMIGGLNLVQGDYDNDGDLDIFILRGAWLADKGEHPNSLLANDGRGFFRDVTFDVGLEEAPAPSHSAAFADYDLDGDLDLYVGSESGYASELWENDGRGRFTNVAARAGVLNRRFAKGVAWGDIDGDRYPDLFVSNYKGENRMYRNNGNGTFTDVAEQVGVTYPLFSFATWFWDYNNDGALDLYVASYIARVDDLAGKYLGREYHGECQCLYEGDGHGGFRDVTAERNLLRVTTTMGANFGDLDNDGYPDFYLGTGYPDYDALMPNVMYHNQQGRRFADVSTAGGFGHLQKGHGVGFGDLDNDGDQDVYIQLGGAFPGDVYGNSLFENPGFGGHWIGVRLVGQRSNRFGVGARIHAVIHEEGLQRDVYQFVTTGGSFGCNPLRQQLGLGRALQVDRLDIFWPATGETQSFQNVGADQFLEITEGKSVYRRLDLKRLEFRRSAPKDADGR